MTDKEYATGTWRGKDIRFNRSFRGHRFTDDEVTVLLAGDPVEVRGLKGKTGKPYGVIGHLEEQVFTNENGEEVKFVGFKQTDFVNDVPEEWCGHRFTDEEISALKNGETLSLAGFVGKNGKKFDADIHYGQDEEGKMRILADFKHEKKDVPMMKLPGAEDIPIDGVPLPFAENHGGGADDVIPADALDEFNPGDYPNEECPFG